MRLRVVRAVGHDDWVYWIIFWEGNVAQPVAVLTDLDMKRFIKQCQEEMGENAT